MELVITLLVVGVVLLVLETILPGAVAGIIGFLCLAAGVAVSYSELGLRAGNVVLAITTLVLVSGFAVWIKYFPNSWVGRLFISRRVVGNINAAQPELINQIGTALTPLRPSGTALINGQRVDVISEGMLIERGTPIKVIAVEGMRTVVSAMTST
jgi:membrane-bound serine protease (ClpP class)